MASRTNFVGGNGVWIGVAFAESNCVFAAETRESKIYKWSYTGDGDTERRKHARDLREKSNAVCNLCMAASR